MLHLRNRYFFALDALLLIAAAYLSFGLRLDLRDLGSFGPACGYYAALAILVKLPIFRWLGLYSRYWRYASVDELTEIVAAVGIASATLAAFIFGVLTPLSLVPRIPLSIPAIDSLLTLAAVGGSRFIVRMAEHHRRRTRNGLDKQQETRVLVMGAGDAGAMIVKEMQNNPQLSMVPIGFLDDSREKHGFKIHGVPVLGTRHDLSALVKTYKIQQVVIAMPTAPGKTLREIVALCDNAGVASKTIPGIYEILSGRVSVTQIRDVDIGDLLRREPVQIDTREIGKMLCDLRILITGAGGSIGAELCRQIAFFQPAQLILLGHGETSIYKIHRELSSLLSAHRLKLNVVPIVADIRDRARLESIFRQYHPQAVFHAAAHKHVPLMEMNVAEAITNNVMGTRNLVECALASDTQRLVMISTDKAVNPVSVMGCSKRVAELIVSSAAHCSKRSFVAVRFGNVLGSRGSVVPLFKRQIATGGPITVTHPDMQRYFMTIPESVQLVLQAAAIGRGGELFMLDMGEPVRILDLARDLIKLSGLHLEQDIDIVFTGVRPGEKLFEELFIPGEGYQPTRHEKIFVVRSNGVGSKVGLVDELIAAACTGDEGEVRRVLKEIVPEYHAYTPLAP